MAERTAVVPRINVPDVNQRVYQVTRLTDVFWDNANVVGVTSLTVAPGRYVVHWSLTLRANAFIDTAWISPTGINTTAINGSQQYLAPPGLFYGCTGSVFYYVATQTTTLYLNIQPSDGVAAGTSVAVDVAATSAGTPLDSVPTIVAIKTGSA